jgi:Sec1 family
LADLLCLGSDAASTSVNTIKDMLAGLPEFSEKKEAFSVHLDMAEKCMKIFQDNKLLDLGSVEQVCACLPLFASNKLTFQVPCHGSRRGLQEAQKSC